MTLANKKPKSGNRPETAKLKAIGIAIRKRRKARKVSLQAVSEVIGKSVATVSRIEAGSQPMEVGTFLLLAEFLEISAGSLLVQVQMEHSPSKIDKQMWKRIRELLG
jgi:transcriptional regulator with XRE-family HTH domain